MANPKTPAQKPNTARKSATTKTAAKKTAATTKTAAKKTAATTNSAAKKTAATTKTAAKKTAATTNSAAKKTAATTKTTAKKSSSKPASHPDAIAVLKADHDKVSRLFDDFEALGPRAHKSRESTVAKIIEELSVHAGIEEAVFYPAVRERFAARDEAMVLEALEEHHLVKLTLNELESMPSQDERYTAKVTVLREVVDHHVEEEETELFKKVRAAFTKSELVDLGQQLDAARPSAPTRPHPAAPDSPPGNALANAVAAPLDAAADLTARAARVVRNAVS